MKETLNISQIRQDFPILQEQVYGKPLIYFDNAATSQKPNIVIDALSGYYQHTNANIHRGAHFLANKATGEYEATRETIRKMLNATSTEEIIFTKGTTEGINLIASTFGRKFIQKDDEILISTMEHHSNIVPWQMLCEEKGAILKIIPITDNGEIILEEYEKLLSERTKLVSIVHISNSLGTINPVKEMISLAHAKGAKVLVDGAQGVVHLDIDVQALDCDFYVFSGHKIFAPTGIGALFGKKDLLNAMPPYQGGGEMISSVSFQKTTYNVLPFKFEAGTPNIADVIAFRLALEYMEKLGKENTADYENYLLKYATERITEINGLKIIGTAKEKASVISFVFDDIHPSDVGTLLDNQGIAVRTGSHCTQPLMERLGISGTTRASFAVYNTTEEIDMFIIALQKVVKMLR